MGTSASTNLQSASSSRREGLGSTLDKGSDFVYENVENVCGQCETEDKHRPAAGFCRDCDDYLCKVCYSTHLRPKPTRNHTLLSLKQMSLKKTEGEVQVQKNTTSKANLHKTQAFRQQHSQVSRPFPTRHFGVRMTKVESIRDFGIKPYYGGNEIHWIAGLAVLAGQKLAVVAENTVSLVPSDRSDSVYVGDQLELPPSLHDIAYVSSTQVAVSSYTEQTIYMLKTRDDDLFIEHKVKVKGQCRGIACIDADLIVTYDKPVKVEVISMEGKVKQTIIHEDNGKNLFTWPWYVATSQDQSMIYIADPGRDTVSCLSLTGDVLATYQDNKLLRGPRGLTVDRTGSVYVCGYNSGNIVQLATDLTQPKELLSFKSTNPWSVCYCQATDIVYIGTRNVKIGVVQMK